MAMAELRALGGCCWRCETAKETEAKQMGARLSAGGRWRDEGAPRRIVACANRALATRGRRHGHAAFVLWRRSATDRLDSVRQSRYTVPDDKF